MLAFLFNVLYPTYGCILVVIAIEELFVDFIANFCSKITNKIKTRNIFIAASGSAGGARQHHAVTTLRPYHR